MDEHESDPYVLAARKDGYRSRAAYKLLEIEEKDHIFKQGMVVVDLGAAPGGWSQIAARLSGENGHVYALDILEMDPLNQTTFIQGDFREQEVIDQLLDAVGDTPIDLVISDMAPNMSGMNAQDQPRMMYLAELALDCAGQVLSPGGDFLVKVFQGEGFDQYVSELRKQFKKVVIRKPKASRSRSREFYLLGRFYNIYP